MARTGRPKKEIDQEVFEGLCRIQCTLEEISSWFKCSEDTIERWCKRTYAQTFAESYKKYSASGKISLRRAQMKLAEKNATMAIWLGKQYLGQKDDEKTAIVSSGVMESLLELHNGRNNMES
jgi:hypothetical protein